MTTRQNIIVIGADGYLGWPIACELIERGHMVMGIDSCAKREHYGLLGRSYAAGDSTAVPISNFNDRRRAMSSYQRIWNFDICETDAVADAIGAFSPDAIVYLAEQTSRTFAMAGPRGATKTYYNNVVGLLKTIGAIVEKKFATHLVRISAIATYDQVHDFCTAATVAADEIVRIACEEWNLRATELFTGAVYGSVTPATQEVADRTRVDYDSCFGGVVHRFCAAVVIGTPMTIYGDGKQRVAITDLSHVVDCVATVFDKAPIGRGTDKKLMTYYDEITVNDIAETVAMAAKTRELNPQISKIANPRGDETWRTQPVPTLQHADVQLPARSFGVDSVGEIIDDLIENKNEINRSLLRVRDVWRRRSF